MEMEPGEGKAHEMKESPDEEVREGTESEEGEEYSKPSRKRSAKGAKRTKAPMDCEGCSGKTAGKCKACTSKAMKDGCGSYPMKKRSDALTAPEYLAACELGIQHKSRNYIRARLDTARRLDLKCGNGAIPQGKTCHKGPASRVSPEIAAAKNIAARTAKNGSLFETSAFNPTTGRLRKGFKVRELSWGERFSSDLKNSFGQAVKNTALTGAVIGGISGAATNGVRGAIGGAAAGAAVGSAFGAIGAPLGAATSATFGYKVSTIERRPTASRRRRSPYADGLVTDFSQIAI